MTIKRTAWRFGQIRWKEKWLFTSKRIKTAKKNLQDHHISQEWERKIISILDLFDAKFGDTGKTSYYRAFPTVSLKGKKFRVITESEIPSHIPRGEEEPSLYDAYGEKDDLDFGQYNFSLGGAKKKKKSAPKKKKAASKKKKAASKKKKSAPRKKKAVSKKKKVSKRKK